MTFGPTSFDEVAHTVGDDARPEPPTSAAGPVTTVVDPDALVAPLSLVEAAPDAMFVVDADGLIVFANGRAGQLFGTTVTDLLGRPIEDLLPDDVRAAHRHHRVTFDRDARTREMGSGLELHARRFDGGVFPAEVSLSPMVHDGARLVVASVRDVTERSRARDHTRRIERLVDRAHEGVYLIDPDTLRITYANAGAAAQTGHERTALVDVSMVDLVADMDEATLRRLLHRAVEEGRFPTIVTLRGRNGEVVVELLLEPEFRRDGTLSAVAALARDVAERRAAEATLEATRAELRILEERERIARDLHDRVIQRLFAAGMHLQAATAAVRGEIRDRVDPVVDELDATVREIRSVIFDLAPDRPSTPLQRRIVAAARDARRALGFEPVVTVHGELPDLGAADGDRLVEDLGAALRRVAATARATRVAVEVHAVDGTICCNVTHDGGPDAGTIRLLAASGRGEDDR